MRNLAEDYDVHGRLLHHAPQYAHYWSLPANEHMMRYHAVIQEPKVGTNGQVRLIESKDCAECRGFMFAQ